MGWVWKEETLREREREPRTPGSILPEHLWVAVLHDCPRPCTMLTALSLGFNGSPFRE